MKWYLLLAGFCLSTGVASAVDLVPLNSENTEQSVNSSTGADNNWSLVSYYDWYGLGVGVTSAYGTTNYSAGTSASYAYKATTTPTSTYWTPNTTSPVAGWIAPSPNEGNGSVGTGSEPGVYTYQLSFSSASTRAVIVSGEVAADNQFAIVYDGVVEVSGPGGGTSLSPGTAQSPNPNYVFSKSNTSSEYGGTYGDNAPISFSFEVTAFSGSNNSNDVIDFLVNNLEILNSSNQPYDPDNNATGLFVTDFSIVAAPEPPTWAILGAGLGLLVLGRRFLPRVRAAEAVVKPNPAA